MAQQTVKIQKHLMAKADKARPTISTGKGKTEQAHKQQCDMNYILRDYQRTGLIKHAAKHEGRYDDVTAVDFQEAMFLVTNAQNMFMTLPSSIRDRFGNDPAAFLDFVQNPSNTDEMARMGILKGNDGLDVSGAQVNSPVAPPPVSDENGPINQKDS